ncbi:MAG: 50S ribosomal protein L20 [bacterium]|nr:50S ribosomal protein L20 [bacterium]
MPRVSTNVASHARKKRILKKAKGYYGTRSRCYRIAKEAVMKAESYAYRDRKAKKRTIRRLWILKINAAARQHGLSYSVFMNRLKKAGLDLNRKVLANLAVNDALAFTKIVETIR